MSILVCLYPFHKIKSAGGVSTASRRLARTINRLNISAIVISYSSFSFSYFKPFELFLRLNIDLFNLYVRSWRKKRIFLMTDTSSLVRTCLYIFLLRLSLNFTPVFVDIRGGGPCSRLSKDSPNKTLLSLTYLLASVVVLQTSNFSPVPISYRYKLRFVCNPLYPIDVHCSNIINTFIQAPFCLSFAGRITETKGIAILFDLLETSTDHFHLFLAGSVSLLDFNLKRMNELIRLGKITYINNVSNSSVCEMISKSHLFVHLSTHPWEGMPNSINDAVAVRTPVLATPVGFIPDLFSSDHLTYISDLTLDSVRTQISFMRDSYSFFKHKAISAFNHANTSYSLESYESSISSLLA